MCTLVASLAHPKYPPYLSSTAQGSRFAFENLLRVSERGVLVRLATWMLGGRTQGVEIAIRRLADQLGRGVIRLRHKV